MGVAPECNLLSIKILDNKGNGKLKHLLEGVTWLLDHHKEYGIRIVNISIGSIAKKGMAEESELVMAINSLWDAGLVVCIAAGNEGSSGKHATVTTPGISRKVITVGSSDDDVMIDDVGRQYLHYSGKGPTKECICKPEIVAPGTNIISANAGYYHKKKPYIMKSGTSMSTPIVSGAVALLLEKYPLMKNTEVKICLRQTAKDLRLPRSHQGWGLLNIEELLKE